MPDFTLPEDALAGMLGELQAAEPEPEPITPDLVEPEPVEPEPAAEPVEPEPAPVEPTPVASPTGHALTDQEWETYSVYRQLEERLATDTDFAARFRSAFEQPQPAAPGPAVPAPELAESYLAQDPAYVALQRQLSELGQTLSRHDQIINQRAAVENEGVMNQVRAQFKTAHSLDDTAMAKVYDAAQAYAPSLTEFSRQGVPLHDALERVFSAAYWSMPEMREAELARQVETQKADQARKAKAGSLSGSSGSVPRSSTPPMNETQRRDAMIREIADAVGGAAE
jgi:hypothetical protein